MTEINSASSGYLDELFEIEKLCFTPAWSKAQLSDEITRDDAFTAVSKENGVITGFCVMRMAGDQAELFQIAVCPDFRRNGTAEKLLSRGICWAREKNAESIFLEVRESNSPAIGLYQKLGFEKLGVRKNYYTQPVENAVIMVRKVM